jgi:hypothetical protein
MTQRIWYAIRHIPSGRLLPAPNIQQRGGQTHQSFDSAGFMPPRLWPTHAGANVAMKLWLRGDWTRKRTHPRRNLPPAGSLQGQLNIAIRRRQPYESVVFENPRTHLAPFVEVVPVEIVVNPIVRPIEDDDDI